MVINAFLQFQCPETALQVTHSETPAHLDNLYPRSLKNSLQR